jgi:hypothetical protein
MEYTNGKKKKKESVREKITMQELKQYFMKLLERKKEKVKPETEMKKKQITPEGTQITVEEVERQIRKLKKRKAPGKDLTSVTGRELVLFNVVWPLPPGSD